MRPGQRKPPATADPVPAEKSATARTRNARATVAISRSRLGEADQEQVKEHLLQAMDVGEHAASVNVAFSLTHNLGHYESLRISVGVTMPCRPSQVYQAAGASALIAQDILDGASDEWLGIANGRRSPSYDQTLPTTSTPDEWSD
jgi:hypothetical protein